MNLLPSIASSSSNIADLFTKPISHHRHRLDTLIGDAPTTFTPPSTSVASTLVASTVDSLATVVASGPTASASVPVALDTGASLAPAPFASDFALEIAQASYGLIRSAFDTSVASNSKVYSEFASTPVDPNTLITGEDAVAFDLSSPDATADTIIDSDFIDSNSFAKVHFGVREFGTASLTFIFSPNLTLIKVFLTPTQVDWLHWIPLPRLILPESYFHIFGLDYLQAFALLHLIPIWIYHLLHFAVNLED